MQENLFLIKEGKKRESYEKKLLLMVSVLAVLFVAVPLVPQNQKRKINTEPYSDRQTMLGTYVQIRIYDDGKEDVLPKAFARVKRTRR